MDKPSFGYDEDGKWSKSLYNRQYNNFMYKTNKDKVVSWGKKWREENPEYSVWRNMNRRCNDQSFDNYENYGGRGIKVLYSSYQEFILDVGHRPKGKYTIDRIDNSKHYEAGNCRWATYTQQNNNRRKLVWKR